MVLWGHGARLCEKDLIQRTTVLFWFHRLRGPRSKGLKAGMYGLEVRVWDVGFGS